MRELAIAAVAEWDSKYRRALLGDFVGLGPSGPDVFERLNAVARRRPVGGYELVCTGTPEPDEYPGMPVDGYTDAQFDAFYAVVAELAGRDTLWVIPREDARFDPESVGVLLTA